MMGLGRFSTLWIVLTSFLSSQLLGHELGRFLSDNGMKFVTVMQNQSSAEYSIKTLLDPVVSGQDLFIRYHQITDKYPGKMHQMNVDCQVILFNMKKDDLQLVMDLLSKTKAARSVLVFSDAWTSDEEQKMTDILATHAENSFFYIAVPDSSGKTFAAWYQIITTKSGFSKSDLLFRRDTMKIQEYFDMQGLKLNSISLSWPPYLNMEECDGQICKHQFGSLIDYMDILSAEFNFSYESFK